MSSFFFINIIHSHSPNKTYYADSTRESKIGLWSDYTIQQYHVDLYYPNTNTLYDSYDYISAWPVGTPIVTACYFEGNELCEETYFD